MPGSSIGTTLNFGFAGTLAYGPDDITEAKPVASDSDNIYFGQPVVLNSDNTFDAPTSTTITAANFAGVARAVTQQNNTYPPDNASGFFAPDQLADVVQRGIVSVFVQRGTPTAGGAVYVRTSLNSSYPNAVVGGFEASSDSSHSVQLTNCSWANGAVDTNGISALKIKTINN
jgi:hypothetical protein